MPCKGYFRLAYSSEKTSSQPTRRVDAGHLVNSIKFTQIHTIKYVLVDRFTDSIVLRSSTTPAAPLGKPGRAPAKRKEYPSMNGRNFPRAYCI